ncbi:MAG: TM2 domain-containing protein [Oscillospiraceae bacterium]|nr:TM2 domain-containing protein [Oscillospiraceae bacterium]
MDNNVNETVSVNGETVTSQTTTQETQPASDTKMKLCKHCGAKIPEDAVICTHCGRQVENIAQSGGSQPQIVINNANDNSNTNTNTNVNANVNAAVSGVALLQAKPKNKWVALALCFFLGCLGAHRFYEGKIGTGILYLCTMGLFGFGVVVDLILILLKPNPYYVKVKVG